jgi:hexosaminidase
MFAPLVAAAVLHVLPQPSHVVRRSCSVPVIGTVPRDIDPGALDELRERWSALGVATVRLASNPQVRFAHDPHLGAQAYRLDVGRRGVLVTSGDGDGAFYGVMTLAQLPERTARGWRLPCVRIDDRPALRWRILSDDVSRGPLPTMAYFERRIRTIAAFKMNGYSPYMESVFASPTDPLPAYPNGITPAQLHALDAYARRFHVAFIPEQQTFAHMHGTLRLEQYASAAEFPHGFLLDPGNAIASGYLRRIIGQELQAVPHPPFFHIGSDETSTLGLGTSAAYVDAHGGRGAVYAAHVQAMNALIAPSGARVMLWDDGIESDPSIMRRLPRSAVIVNWHYDVRPTYAPLIALLASGGFAQMVAPGADNWNRFFPDLSQALPNAQRFIDDGKQAHVLGLFQTVWHDDGKTLSQETWYPLLFAAADAWSTTANVASDFPSAFFGIDDPAFTDDAQRLGSIEARLPAPSDRLEFADPFTTDIGSLDLRALRLDAERVERHLILTHPPLHAGAADAMLLAAQRYDALGRRFQIAREVRAMYADASAHPDQEIRDLFWCKYWFWELRDTDERIAAAYARVWRAANREEHLAGNLDAYHADAMRAIAWADAIDRVTYDDATKHRPLPPLDDVLGEKP